MPTPTPFLAAISPTLPAELSDLLTTFQTPAAAQTLDTLIRFVAGGDSPDPQTQKKWSERQQDAIAALRGLIATTNGNGKRRREQEAGSELDSAKRQKTEAAADHGPPLLTLHSISTTSPIRKKVDITVHESTVTFVNSSTGAIESSIPLSALKRAFLLPTRGKTKAHWSVVVLSADAPPGSKKDVAGPQIIFGLDASAGSGVKYTTYTDSTPELTTLKSGTPTRDVLLDFIRRLQLYVLEPTPAVFQSACPGTGVSASEGGIPGVQAYRAAKEGTLWFLRAGVLWGESKPCEFWALADLLGRDDGVRIISATGRTCTVVFTRKSMPEERTKLEEEEETDPGVETAFSMVDGKEQGPINKWVREHRDLFGKEAVAGAEAVKVQDDSDEEDADFEEDSESDGGSATDSSSDDDDADTASEEAEESGEDKDADVDADGDEEEEEELHPENHPLMRPGAMPRMSRAAIDMVAIDMVATMVQSDLVGDEDDDMEDELED